jgi:hypothetical protein
VHLESRLLLRGSLALGFRRNDSRLLLSSCLGSLLRSECGFALLDGSGHVAISPPVCGLLARYLTII